MSSKTPNEIGDEGERHVMKLLQGRRVGGSGSGKFLKLDVKDAGNFIYSVKSMENVSNAGVRAIIKLWRETVKGARGAAGHGDSARPAMVFNVDGETLMVCRLADHVEMATGEAAPYIAPSKAAERRARATRRPSQS